MRIPIDSCSTQRIVFFFFFFTRIPSPSNLYLYKANVFNHGKKEEIILNLTLLIFMVGKSTWSTLFKSGDFDKVSFDRFRHDRSSTNKQKVRYRHEVGNTYIHIYIYTYIHTYIHTLQYFTL